MQLSRTLFFTACFGIMTLGSMDAGADTAAQKFGRGLAGITCSFLELPGNIVKKTQKQGAVGIPMGLAKGVGMIVTRELVGGL